MPEITKNKAALKLLFIGKNFIARGQQRAATSTLPGSLVICRAI